MKKKFKKPQLIVLIAIVFFAFAFGVSECNSRGQIDRVKAEHLRLQDSIKEAHEVEEVAFKMEREEIAKIKAENTDPEKQAFKKYVDDCKSKNYTCIKIKEDAVYVIHSLTVKQTKWEYYEIGKKKIIYRAKLRGTLPFYIENMNLIGWELTDSKGGQLLGAVAINMETYKRGIVLYKNGHQQEYDEIK